MRLDKKAAGSEIRFVFLRRLGKAEAVRLPLDRLLDCL